MNTNVYKQKIPMLLEILLLGLVVGSSALSCLDDQGNKVDWFIVYKLPKLQYYKKLVSAPKGLAYLYTNSLKENMVNWKLSSSYITDKFSSPGRTLDAIFTKKNNDLSILMYNDQPPNTDSTANGHSKGVVAFDKISGIWLIHSVPKFPLAGDYEYPPNALDNGQTMLCISLNFNSINDVGQQLLYIRPKIYYTQRSDATNKLDVRVQSLFKKSPNFVRKLPWTRTINITSVDNIPFKSFAKSGRWGGELYGELVAPELKSSLFVETWRRGSGTILPPTCQIKFIIQDVEKLNITVDGQNFFFSYTEDHSKWAVSSGVDSWICIADINRMESQAKRGGGAACFQSAPVKKMFTRSIKEVNACDIKRG